MSIDTKSIRNVYTPNKEQEERLNIKTNFSMCTTLILFHSHTLNMLGSTHNIESIYIRII